MTRWLRGAEDADRGARILFTSPVFEYPATGGPWLRIENSIKALSRVAEIHVHCRVPYGDMGGRPAVEAYRKLCKALVFSPGRGALACAVADFGRSRFRPRNRLAYRLANLPFKAVDMLRLTQKSVDEAAFVVRYARWHRIDTIWFGFGNLSYTLMKEVSHRAPKLRLVCDTDSVWSRFILRGVPFQSDQDRRTEMEAQAQQSEIEEREWVNLCDATTAVSDVDAAYYRDLAADPKRIHIFSNVIDVREYTHRPPAPSGFQKPCVYLAGTFWRDSPMEHAARWTLREVMPRLWARWPHLHCYIVGKGSDAVLAEVRSPEVTVTGGVDSVLPYLRNADVACVPLMFESGTRFKILEAGVCRVPVVSTTLGAEGLPVINDEHILLADAPESFAGAIARVIEDAELRSRLTGNLATLVEAKYSIDALAREGGVILASLHARSPRQTSEDPAQASQAT